MERIVIDGGKRLVGSVRVSGTKNAVLKMLAAALMTSETCVFRNVPHISDVTNMMQLLRGLGADVSLSSDGVLQVKAEAIGHVAPEAAVRQMRASVQVMGPLLARLRRVRISLPGGCDIGARPIDLHLKGLRALGAELHESHGWVEGYANRLVGTDIHLDQPSVGATENLMMAATLAVGTTTIRNAAKEPEIAEAAEVLNAMGARIEGAGSDTIRVHGVQELGGCDHEVSPDRIEAGTFMVAGALTGGTVHLHPVVPGHLDAVIAKLRESGSTVETTADSITVKGGAIHPVQIRTQPYPGFPTDMQPQFVALLTRAQGTSLVTETVYSSRFKYADELRRLGADISVEGSLAVVRGGTQLSGSEVNAPDLRAGACMVLAGLVASGTTVVDGVHHIDRGYERLVEKLSALGASIRRESA